MRTIVILLLSCAWAASIQAADGAIDPASLTIFKPYPLDTCIVSDEALGSMGEPLSFVHEGQEFTICCRGCLKSFAKDPAACHAKLEASRAESAAKPAEAHQGHDHGTGHDHADHGH